MNWLFQQFNDYESEAKRLMEAALPLPAYEMVLKCSHAFNLLDARGAISTTERAAYIGRVRALARLVAQSYYESRERLGFPMCRSTSAAKAEGIPTRFARSSCHKERAESGRCLSGVAGRNKMKDSLLIELLTEELPPKALPRLMEAFSRGVYEGLKEKNFLGADADPRPFATPRRLAVLVSHVLDKQADRVIERKGPAVAAGLGADGKPTPALAGFARSCGVDVAKLEKRTGEKGEYFVYCAKQKGEPLKTHLGAIIETALKKLPIPKLMRWGAGEAQFVRPVHGVMLLHGNKVVPGTVLGLKSGNKTLGHRFLSKGAVTVRSARDYEKHWRNRARWLPTLRRGAKALHARSMPRLRKSVAA